MSDLSNLITNETNYVNLYCQNLQAGTCGMPTRVISFTGATVNPCPVTLGALYFSNGLYQLYSQQGAYYNVRGGGSQITNTSNNTITFVGATNLLNMNCGAMTAGILPILVSGIYKAVYTISYNPPNPNTNTVTTQLIVNSVVYGESMFTAITGPTVITGVALINISAGQNIYLNLQSSLPSVALNDCCLCLELISAY